MTVFKTRTIRMPVFWGYPPPPHDYPYYWFILDPKSKEDKVKVINLKNLPKFHIFLFWNKHYMWHTFWSCLIIYANMKWIWQVLLKIQSGHYSVHRQTDGQSETSIPPFQLCWSEGYDDQSLCDTWQYYEFCKWKSLLTMPSQSSARQILGVHGFCWVCKTSNISVAMVTKMSSIETRIFRTLVLNATITGQFPLDDLLNYSLPLCGNTVRVFSALQGPLLLIWINYCHEILCVI